MTGISRIGINHIRCIRHAEFTLHPNFTLLCGPNGSGKTSVLEAIHILSLARSFRTQNITKVISDDASKCSVIADYTDLSGGKKVIGVEKNREGDTLMRIDRQAIKTAAELTSLLPLRIISQESYSLIDGSSKGRRQLLDWLAFHVEPQFNQTWGMTQRLLKQRNALLKRKQGFDLNELNSWDTELSQCSEQINEFRTSAFNRFSAHFITYIAELLPSATLRLDLYKGWPEGQTLRESLFAGIERDRKLGYTHHSPNRADIAIKVGNKLAAECLSRGQKKILVYALVLAQVATLFSSLKEKHQQLRTLVLIDDMGAELDIKNQNLLLDTLARCNSQVLITGTELAWMKNAISPDRCKLFHVEQGAINLA